jgi:hypothetical protein
MRVSRLAKVSVCLLALCLAGVGPVFAQTQNGSINGVVKDPNGEALPGVVVSVSGASVMGSRTAVTGESGDFRVPNLLPGSDFVVQFGLDGFQTVIREDIRVSVGLTTTLQMVMELSAVAKEIVVTGESPIVDITSPSSSTSFDSDLLANIPNNRNWATVVFQTPGVVNGSTSGYGNLYSNRGGSVVANETAVDGVANTNPVYHTAGHPLVYETIEEIQVMTGALPAELGNVAGSYVNMVTKSGGNEFRGHMAYYYQDKSLQGDNLNDELREAGLTTPPELTQHDDYSFNLGGPIVRDKLWFSVGYWKLLNASLIEGFPFENPTDNSSYFGKFTWQPAANHNLMGLINQTGGDQPYYGATRFLTPEATQTYDYLWSLWKLQWTMVITDNAFVEASASTANTDSEWGPQADSTSAYLELYTGVVSGGPPNTQFNDSTRDQANAALSLFKDGWAGNHAFKLGVQWEHSEFNWDNYRIGTPLSAHYLLGGAAYLALFYNMPDGGRVTTINHQDGLHFYAQDSWRVSNRVTLSLGVRVNTWQAKYPAQGSDGYQYGPDISFPAIQIEDTTVVDWTAFEPRLGATIALDDQGKSALRIGLSRYHHSLNISSTLLGCPNALAYSLALWDDLDGNLFADPTDDYIPIQLGGGAANSMDPNVAQPYTDEITIGWERELFRDFSITVNATWREDHDLIDDVNVAIDEGSFIPVDIPDPGPDSVLGTADDQILTLFNQVDDFATELLITNPELAKRKYKGVELIATKRMSKNWQALASIVWQESTGTMGTDIHSSTGWSNGFNSPNALINIGGPLSLDHEWQVKVIGTYLLPLGFSVSGYWTMQTGAPLYRTYAVTDFYQGTASAFADPWDRHRQDDYSQLDLRAEKVFSFGSRPFEVGLILDAFNVFNENNVTSRFTGTGSWSVGTQTLTPGIYPFGTPLEVQAPRILRIGARLRF